MTKRAVKIGDILTIKESMSGERMGKCRAEGCALCNQSTYPTYHTIEPGMIGVVKSVDVPAVTRNKAFVCLDFEYQGHVYRTRPWYNQLKELPYAFRDSIAKGMLEITLSQELIDECTIPGVPADNAIKGWISKLRPYLNDLEPAVLVAILREVGGDWTAEDLEDHEANLERILWVAANDCKEEKTRTTILDGSYYYGHNDR